MCRAQYLGPFLKGEGHTRTSTFVMKPSTFVVNDSKKAYQTPYRASAQNCAKYIFSKIWGFWWFQMCFNMLHIVKKIFIYNSFPPFIIVGNQTILSQKYVLAVQNYAKSS